MFIHLLPLYIYSSIAFMLFFISKYAFLFYSFIFYSIDKKRFLIFSVFNRSQDSAVWRSAIISLTFINRVSEPRSFSSSFMVI